MLGKNIVINKDDGDISQRYLESKEGDLTAYAGMIGAEFDTKINRLAQIIGRNHELSVGNYKESILRNCIRQFIPKRYSVGTGFIAFTRESKVSSVLRQRDDYVDLLNRKELYVSKQLDIIVFDDYNFAPILQDAEFVVVRPESVRAVIEVKGYLTKKVIIDSVESFIDLGRKWNEYSEYNPRWGREKLHTLGFHLMGIDVHVNSKTNKPACNGKILRNTIVETYRKHLNQDELQGNLIPLLNSAYIYNDCIVNSTTLGQPDLSGTGIGLPNLLGYSTSRGRFVRYNNNLEPSLDRDKTISSLLASISVHLDITRFNQDFSHSDQSNSLSVFPHKSSGFTELISGKEIAL